LPPTSSTKITCPRSFTVRLSSMRGPPCATGGLATSIVAVPPARTFAESSNSSFHSRETGARIGEVLALRWRDIDLGARIVEINATIKTESGIGTYRKSLSRPRTVALPEFAALILEARRIADPGNFLDAVFPTRNVTWQQVNNVERRWRQIRRDAGLEWVTPEVFRRSSPEPEHSRNCLPER
jgi:integrase